jgi:isochorismate pyruvate lyase
VERDDAADPRRRDGEPRLRRQRHAAAIALATIHSISPLAPRPGPPMTAPEEPRADAAAVRRFRDPHYRNQATTLGELRRRIDAIDAQVVELIAARALCVRDATRFKRDAHQVAAPKRQAEVLGRVRALAAAKASDFPPLPDLVESAYRVLVAGFVACEERFLGETETIEP